MCRGRQTAEDLLPSSLKYLETYHEEPIQSLHIARLIYRLNTIAIKIPADFFAETDKQKFVWKFKRPRKRKKKKFKESRRAKIILKKNNKVGRLILLGFETCYKATVIKTEILT